MADPIFNRPTPMTLDEIEKRRKDVQAGKTPPGVGRGISLSAQLAGNSDNIALQAVLLTRIADTLDKIQATMEKQT